MIAKLRALSRKNLALTAFGIGVAFGVLAFAAVRFAALPSGTVHYHATMAVYLDGRQETFSGPQFYEEVASCSDAHDSPKGRVHLHDNKPQVVHVHDHVVTWADLFNNFGWSLSNSAVYDGETLYKDGEDGKQLSFILNGQPTASIANEVIGNKDRLLISYGNEDDAILQQRYATVPDDAAHYNTTADPAACQGAAQDSVWARFKRAVWQ